jgi:hypothetical protein
LEQRHLGDSVDVSFLTELSESKQLSEVEVDFYFEINNCTFFHQKLTVFFLSEGFVMSVDIYKQ